MSPASRSFVSFISGCIVTTCVWIIVDDWHMAAHAGESMACRDKPDTTAYMARLPGEAHSVESCIRVPRYGDPAWIPFMTSPLKGG